VIERRAHLDPHASESAHGTGAAIEFQAIHENAESESGRLSAHKAIGSTSEGGSLARKRFQRGTVFLRGKNPVWIGRYREDVIGMSGSPVRVLKSVVLGTKSELPTKRLAERRMELTLARINSPAYRPGRVATLEEFAERWKTEILSKRKPSTIHAANSHLKIQILPALGKLRLSEIGVENQQAFVTRLSGTVSRKMLLNVLGTLSSILKTAQNWNYSCEGLSFNKLVLPERSIQEKPACFTPEQATAIISRATGQYRVMFAIAATTGLRAGEILGLSAEDFDFQNNLFCVRQSVWRGKLQTLKTIRSQAILPLPEALAKIVKEHVESLPATSPRWLFLNNRKHFFIAENVVRQALVPILDLLKIPRCGFHAFRHLHTSLLLSSGAALPVAQAQLRHSDPRVTLGIYGHVIGNAHREAVDKVASILFPNVPNSKPQTEMIQ
jgi:integrase